MSQQLKATYWMSTVQFVALTSVWHLHIMHLKATEESSEVTSTQSHILDVLFVALTSAVTSSNLSNFKAFWASMDLHIDMKCQIMHRCIFWSQMKCQIMHGQMFWSCLKMPRYYSKPGLVKSLKKINCFYNRKRLPQYLVGIECFSIIQKECCEIRQIYGFSCESLTGQQT